MMARLSPPPLPPPHTHTQYYGIHVVLTLANYEPNLGGIQVRGARIRRETHPVTAGSDRILSRPLACLLRPIQFAGRIRMLSSSDQYI